MSMMIIHSLVYKPDSFFFCVGGGAHKRKMSLARETRLCIFTGDFKGGIYRAPLLTLSRRKVTVYIVIIIK